MAKGAKWSFYHSIGLKMVKITVTVPTPLKRMVYVITFPNQSHPPESPLLVSNREERQL